MSVWCNRKKSLAGDFFQKRAILAQIKEQRINNLPEELVNELRHVAANKPMKAEVKSQKSIARLEHLGLVMHAGTRYMLTSKAKELNILK